jgi:hypothetical protein
MEPERSLRVDNSHPPVPLLSQINPLYNLSCSIFKIRFNIILPSKSGSYKSSTSLRCSHQNPVLCSKAIILLPRCRVLFQIFGQKHTYERLRKLKNTAYRSITLRLQLLSERSLEIKPLFSTSCIGTQYKDFLISVQMR